MTRKPAILASLAIAGTLVLAACGGGSAATQAPATAAPTTAPTMAPTVAPTVAPTPTPAESLPPTATPGGTNEPSIGTDASPNPALGGFAFAPKDVLDYYISTGFECEDPYASTQAQGYTVTRCLVERDNGLIHLIALVVNDDSGAIGNAFAAVLRRPGETMPTADEAAEHLGGFTTAMLGAGADGIAAATWTGSNLGKEANQTVNGILQGVYSTNDETGVGLYVEFANDAFLNAPKP